MARHLLTALLITTALGGCSLAPDFRLPDIGLPKAFKEQPPVPQDGSAAMQGEWKPAQALEKADRGAWWKIFGDSKLNDLETQAQEANQSLKAAAARVEQARALVRANALTFLPQIDLGGNAVRSQPSSAAAAAFGAPANLHLKPYTLYSAQATASYEVDLFARALDTEKAFRLDADAQEALYRSTLLALQADVAQNYFALRALDSERALLADTIKIRQKAARIMKDQFNQGETGESDYTRTQSELYSTQADLAGLNRQRATLEHALAVLLGKMPSEFSFAESPLALAPPQIPAGLPSTLLERRPDVTAAQNSMAAANRRIGVARTAYFPSLILTGSGGYESTKLGDLFSLPTRIWALGQLAGNALSWTVFDSGRTSGQVDAAKAAYEESVANYRSQALAAFRDVEDSLADQRLLAEQSLRLDEAARAAERTTDLTQKRYDQGDATYFEVVDAQRISLAAERASVQTRGQRFVTTVALIRALGGGWEGEQLQD